MIDRIDALWAVFVDGQDKAIDFYIHIVGFEVTEEGNKPGVS
jgi:hypothetical protein